MSPFDSPPMVPIISPLTLYLLPFFRYLAGSRSTSARSSDPDTMTNTALQAIASSSDKNVNNSILFKLYHFLCRYICYKKKVFFDLLDKIIRVHIVNKS